MMHVLEVGRPAKSECVKFSLSLSLSLSLPHDQLSKHRFWILPPHLRMCGDMCDHISVGPCAGYKEIVSLLLQSATGPEQIRRLLDAHDVDGDTVSATILFQNILLLLFIECVSVTISLLIASQQNEP